MISPKKTSVYFTHSKSNYHCFDTDCFDIERDAFTTTLQDPAIYHPPCAQWSKMKHFSRFDIKQKWAGVWSIMRVRELGGIVEHPKGSGLFKYFDISNNIDFYGGFLFSVDQFWFGHKCKKETLLYIVGCQLSDLPPLPLRFDLVEYNLTSNMKRSKNTIIKPSITKKERIETPLLFCEWLINVNNIIKTKHKNGY